MIAAFIIWAVIGLFFVGIGIYCFFAKKPMGFWANAETFAVYNVDGYNRAVGMMWIVYGIVFALLGLPMLDGQNSPLVIISVIGIMIESIAMMIVYTVVIEKKYKTKR